MPNAACLMPDAFPMPSTFPISDRHFWYASVLALLALVWVLRGLIPAKWWPRWLAGKHAKGKKTTLTVSAKKVRDNSLE